MSKQWPREVRKTKLNTFGPNPIWAVDLNSKENGLAFRIENFSMRPKAYLETWLEENIGNKVAEHVLQRLDRTDLWHAYSSMMTQENGTTVRYYFNDLSNATAFWDEFKADGVRVVVSRESVRGEDWVDLHKDLPYDNMEWATALHKHPGYEIVCRDPKVAMLIKLKWSLTE
jgi:hypothetical protein